ncbi:MULTISPECIES: macro domain-containing protein [unclassified Clostridium]|uniref:macro domain-containing protein n=1 Tax=unclassified Clostridium TaxID=2614128 RepID=UPI001C8BBD05|nr:MULTISPECIES: macro domain-containing protein [unclassified Clostridium]MBX9139082.1 hypothetical protein [Clostridium sp. K12(2020)]MBX9145847.1 hypothetical protein [Clostridium sp. K13]
MKGKIKLFDKQLIKEYYGILSVLSLICSFIFIFAEVPTGCKVIAAGFFIVILVGIYIVLWRKANRLEKVEIKINNSVIEVKVGDVFQENGLKVIAFNEYFDTIVDNKIISEKSLNGLYIKNVEKDVAKLDKLIIDDDELKDKIEEENNSRRRGKKIKYRLGSTVEVEEYLLTAFSKFDNSNRAYLYMHDYINCLMNFWNEIDRIYAGRSVSIPLLGSGITRFKEYETISHQELLELLIWSFKVSRVKFNYPSKVTIIIHESQKDKINFYRLKGIK